MEDVATQARSRRTDDWDSRYGDWSGSNSHRPSAADAGGRRRGSFTVRPSRLRPPTKDPLARKECGLDDTRDSRTSTAFAKRRSALVLNILKGEFSVREATRQQGRKVGEVENWRDRLLLGAENVWRSRPAPALAE